MENGISTALIVTMSIIFTLGGLGFCSIAVYLGLPKNADSFFCKVASKIFLLIGAVTLVSGILGFIFMKELTKTAVELYLIIYLLLVTAAASVFTVILNKKK